MTLQTPSQSPTKHGGPDAVGIDAWPMAHVDRVATESLGDEGMVGQHRNDRVKMLNAHPHQEHSVGYHDSHGTQYSTHGIDAVHFIHGKREKGAEHHPPKGLMEHNAIDHSSK